MKSRILGVSLVFVCNYQLFSQDIPGLSYCLLFDSYIEKKAFENLSNNENDELFFLAHQPDIDSLLYETIQTEIHDFSKKLDSKRRKFKTEPKFLHYVFKKVHRKYLKKYKYSGTFNELFTNRNYNCVSGTALYSSVLKQLGYSPKIFETRYHIFLLVWLDNSARILFEATDPLNGFVDSERKISTCIKGYMHREQQTIDEQLTLSAPFNDKLILSIVSQRQLAGLQYYNLAVHLINKENYFDAFRMLKKASLLYPTSLRIKECILFAKMRYEMQLSNEFANN